MGSTYREEKMSEVALMDSELYFKVIKEYVVMAGTSKEYKKDLLYWMR